MTIPAAVFLLSIFWQQAILSSMTDRQNITIGRVRQAYGLTAREGEMLVQALWPDAVQPLELWRGVYETCWQAFVASCHAVYGTQLPEFPSAPEPDTGLQTYLLGFDVMEFFKTISTVVPLNSLRYGLDVILEESFEDTASVFPKEREFLFSGLERLKTEDIFEQYSPDSPLFEKPIFSMPASSYHFIAHIFADTIMVDRDAAIRHLRHCPLRREVKGITRALVESLLRAAPPESSVADKAAAVPLCERSSQDGKLVFRIPGAVWEGRPDAAVRDAMKEKYPLEVIAYVLLYWCGSQSSGTGHNASMGRKTHVGRLLAKKEYRDDKSYRNMVDNLLKRTNAYSIVKA